MGAKQTLKITQSTFMQLGLLLSVNTKPSDIEHDLMIALQTEELYLPIIELANRHWLTGALCYRLKKLKIFSQLPHILQQYLNEVSQLYRQRNLAIKRETISVCDLLVAQGIEVILLKGSASLFSGLYPAPSIRYMCDIDILVKPEDQQGAFELLLAQGYRTEASGYGIHAKNHHHAPALSLPDSMCSIEIHRQALKYPASNALSDVDIRRAAELLSLGGSLCVQHLNVTQQVIHCIAHSEISHSGFAEKYLDYRQFYHLHWLANVYQQMIDWRLVEKHFQIAGQEKQLYAALNALELLFSDSTPITRSCSNSLQHIEQRILLACKPSWLRSKFHLLSRVLAGYNRESIKFTYDVSGFFGVMSARIQHFRRHCKLIINREYRREFWGSHN